MQYITSDIYMPQDKLMGREIIAWCLLQDSHHNGPVWWQQKSRRDHGYDLLIGLQDSHRCWGGCHIIIMYTCRHDSSWTRICLVACNQSYIITISDMTGPSSRSCQCQYTVYPGRWWRGSWNQRLHALNLPFWPLEVSEQSKHSLHYMFCGLCPGQSPWKHRLGMCMYQ